MILENRGKIIIWSDVDIEFFSRCTDLINTAIGGKGIVFQAEWWPRKEVNSGFAVMRCNERTLQLYQLVSEMHTENLPHANQSAINYILAQKKLHVFWDILPNQFWAMSHYQFDSSFSPADTVLHHVNCTAPVVCNGEKIGSVELKLHQMKNVKTFLRLNYSVEN